MLNRIRNLIQKFRKNPRWAMRELLARLRVLFSPRSGKRQRKIGRINFVFDLDLDAGRRNLIRRMYCDSYEIESVALMRTLLKPGDTFVDIGANVGYLSAVGADCVGPTGRVLSFEPHPILYTYLQNASLLNPDFSWETHNVAIGPERCSATLSAAPHNIGWNTLLSSDYSPPGAKTYEVEVRKLEDFLVGEERIALLKLDVEGYDGVVLLGIRKLLHSGRIKNLLVELSVPEKLGLPVSFDEIACLLHEAGYHSYEVREPYCALSLDPPKFQDVWLRLEREAELKR